MRLASTALVLLASIMLLGPQSGFAKGRIDQSATGPFFGYENLSNPPQFLVQTFRPTATALTGVRLGLTRAGQGSTNVTVTIRYGDSTGPVVASATRNLPDYAPGMPFDFLVPTHLEYFDFPTAPAIIPGQVYVIQAKGDSGGHAWVFLGFDAYPDGHAGLQDYGSDFIFQTCGNGRGKLCKEKTEILDKAGKPKGPDCIDFDSDGSCSPSWRA